MKKVNGFFFVFVMIFTTTFSEKVKAQITLDASIAPQMGLGLDFKIVQISATETKYYKADTLSNTFNLYNMDFSPFITNVSVPAPFAPSQGYYRASYISRTLFDCDSTNIEYLLESPNYISCANAVYVMRTDGTQLFKLDSARLAWFIGGGGDGVINPIVNTSSGAKLVVTHPLCSIAKDYLQIYSLCGNLPLSDQDLNDKIAKTFVNVFPNPASNLLKFEVSPPSNMDELELVIIDNQAKEVIREKVLGNRSYTVDVSNYSNGMYHYTLCTKNKSYQVGTFILNH